MEWLKDRRLALPLIGGVVALIAGLSIGSVLVFSHRDEKPPPAPASQGGLVIDAAAPDDDLDPAKPLRCFVAGQFAGDMTLAACAERNGVATAALDVGIDTTGALAAAGEAGTVLTPLPPKVVVAAAPAVVAAPSAPMGACWRYAGSEWRRQPTEMTLSACVQTLYAGRCEKPGGATYGRWREQTLRLVPNRVEVSADNRTFRSLVEQGPGCAIPAVG